MWVHIWKSGKCSSSISKVDVCLMIHNIWSSLWQDDETTLSEEEELAKKEVSDHLDEVIFAINMKYHWIVCIVMHSSFFCNKQKLGSTLVPGDSFVSIVIICNYARLSISIFQKFACLILDLNSSAVYINYQDMKLAKIFICSSWSYMFCFTLD